MQWRDQKLSSDDAWGEIRRQWEAGETGASLARRYNVGLANLWRRRASEHWRRPERADPTPEPVEGWERWAQAQVDVFSGRLTEERGLALALLAALRNEAAPDGVSLWHLPFVVEWRAENLGPETAAADRVKLLDHLPWTEAFWDQDGRLARLDYMDMVTMMANRDLWREEIGLPEGAAKDVP